MTSTDPLAVERFRTIISDNLTRADRDVVRDGILEDFPGAYFEHRTNEHGVRMRRVVAEGEWEVDPHPVEPLSTGHCTDPSCSSAHIPNHAHMTQAGQQAALASVMEALRADDDPE